MTELIIGSINTTSFQQLDRRVEIDKHITTNKFDFCLLQETRLKQKHTILSNGYQCIRNDDGVGTGILVKNKIKVEELEPFNLRVVSCTGIRVLGGKNKNLFLFSIYIPCASARSDIISDLNSIVTITKGNPTVIGGDLNVGTSSQYQTIHSWVDNNAALFNLVAPLKATFRSGSKLDYFIFSTDILTTPKCKVTNLGLEHNLIHTNFSLNFMAVINKDRIGFKWRKANWEQFSEVANFSTFVPNDRNITDGEIDNLVQSLTDDINRTINFEIPKGLIGRRMLNDLPKEIDHFYKERRRLKLALRRAKGKWLADIDRIEHIKRGISEATKEINKIIKKECNDALEKRLTNINGNINRFKEVKALSGQPSTIRKIRLKDATGKEITKDVDKANYLKDFYEQLYKEKIPVCDKENEVNAVLEMLPTVRNLTEFSSDNTAVKPSKMINVFTNFQELGG